MSSIFSIKIVNLSEGSTVITEICDTINDNDDYEIGNNALDLAYKCFDNLPLLNFLSDTIVAAFTKETKSKLIGFCSLEFTDGLHIESLCVDINYRKIGVGKSILDTVYEIGKTLNNKKHNWGELLEIPKNNIFTVNIELKYITLEVNRNICNYKKLIEFYTKYGFEMSTVHGYSNSYFRKLIPI